MTKDRRFVTRMYECRLISYDDYVVMLKPRKALPQKLVKKLFLGGDLVPVLKEYVPKTHKDRGEM
jgi:hypothetical protein